MKHVDAFVELSNVKNSVLSSGTHPDLLHSGAMEDIGFQSEGSRPDCTRYNSYPARCLASAGKFPMSLRDEPSQKSAFNIRLVNIQVFV